MDKLITTLPKNATYAYHLALQEYKGARYVDLRLHVTLEGQDPIPTKRGLTIPYHLWPLFRQALTKVDDALVEAGWLDREDLT